MFVTCRRLGETAIVNDEHAIDCEMEDVHHYLIVSTSTLSLMRAHLSDEFRGCPRKKSCSLKSAQICLEIIQYSVSIEKTMMLEYEDCSQR